MFPNLVMSCFTLPNLTLLYLVSPVLPCFTLPCLTDRGGDPLSEEAITGVVLDRRQKYLDVCLRTADAALIDKKVTHISISSTQLETLQQYRKQ
jgi:hypothetical protein